MQHPNKNGVYDEEAREEIARYGRAYARVSLCQCEDGLHRHALAIEWSTGGRFEPISADDEGFPTREAAINAAARALLARFPKAWPSEPRRAHEELAALRSQVEARIAQPSLFDFL